jgi:hypothetical protein
MVCRPFGGGNRRKIHVITEKKFLPFREVIGVKPGKPSNPAKADLPAVPLARADWTFPLEPACKSFSLPSLM